MTIYFTGDQHFNHENIINYCRRPFRNSQQMNHRIIMNYQKVVQPDDTVYFLGDLTLAGPARRYTVEHFVEQLPGRKILILGNHDKLDALTYVDIGFESAHTSLDIGEFVLVHDPAVANVDMTRRWLCGHIHNLFTLSRNRQVLNVGVDPHGFFPISIEEVRQIFEEGKT